MADSSSSRKFRSSTQLIPVQWGISRFSLNFVQMPACASCSLSFYASRSKYTSGCKYVKSWTEPMFAIALLISLAHLLSNTPHYIHWIHTGIHWKTTQHPCQKLSFQGCNSIHLCSPYNIERRIWLGPSPSTRRCRFLQTPSYLFTNIAIVSCFELLLFQTSSFSQVVLGNKYEFVRGLLQTLSALLSLLCW